MSNKSEAEHHFPTVFFVVVVAHIAINILGYSVCFFLNIFIYNVFCFRM